MMIARQGIGNAAFVHYDERNAVRLRPFFIWSCGKKVRARRNRSLVDETISTSGCSLSRSRSRMNFCRAPVCLKASPTSVKIHSVVRTWRLPIDCNSSGMPSITSAPVSDEMNRVPEDLHRRGGPMKIMIVILRVIPVAEPPRSRLPPAALRPTIFRRRQFFLPAARAVSDLLGRAHPVSTSLDDLLRAHL